MLHFRAFLVFLGRWTISEPHSSHHNSMIRMIRVNYYWKCPFLGDLCELFKFKEANPKCEALVDSLFRNEIRYLLHSPVRPLIPFQQFPPTLLPLILCKARYYDSAMCTSCMNDPNRMLSSILTLWRRLLITYFPNESEEALRSIRRK